MELIVDKIIVYEDHIDVKLKADIDSITKCGVLPNEEDAANFSDGTEDISQTTLVQRAEKRPDKVFRVNIVSDGDPLEIYTEKGWGSHFQKVFPYGRAYRICRQDL